MDIFIDFLTFIFKNLGKEFLTLFCLVIFISFVYMLLHFYFEVGYVKKNNKKITIIQRIKGRIYGIKPELLK